MSKAETLLREWATRHGYSGDLSTLLRAHEAHGGYAERGAPPWTLENFLEAELGRLDIRGLGEDPYPIAENRAKLAYADRLLEALEELESNRRRSRNTRGRQRVSAPAS